MQADYSEKEQETDLAGLQQAVSNHARELHRRELEASAPNVIAFPVRSADDDENGGVA